MSAVTAVSHRLAHKKRGSEIMGSRQAPAQRVFLFPGCCRAMRNILVCIEGFVSHLSFMCPTSTCFRSTRQWTSSRSKPREPASIPSRDFATMSVFFSPSLTPLPARPDQLPVALANRPKDRSLSVPACGRLEAIAPVPHLPQQPTTPVAFCSSTRSRS